MDSPLTRQARPDAFEPKIVELYRQLFPSSVTDEHEDLEPSEGFWREFFLLKPDKQGLYGILEPLTAEDILRIQTHSRLFFRRAIEEAGSGMAPRNENALDNLTAFLCAILDKRYMNPSTDVIEVLAGLDSIDKLVSDLVQGLDSIIKQSPRGDFRRKAVDTALSMVSGSYQTSLVTYFIHRDLFPALMKYAHESPEPTPEILVLLGLLANYNKFEAQNVYQNRLEDFVNEETIHGLVLDFAKVCSSIRTSYITIQDDAPVPWTITSTLQMVGLRSLTPEAKKPIPPTEEEAKRLFNALPNPEAAVILSAYSFVQANKIFASHLISTTPLKESNESPLVLFFSVTSYLCHHAHRSVRSVHYSILALLTMRLLVEDSVILKRLSSSDSKAVIRLSRQRAPHLPHVSHSRIPSTIILDICTDTLSHNLRKRLSIPLYNLSLTIIHCLVDHLDSTKTRLQHHWSYIWGSLLSLLRFLTQWATELTAIPSQAAQIKADVCTPLVSILAFCLSRGDNFLPDPSGYDDLFYKVIEATTILPKFKELYCPSSTTLTSTRSTNTPSSTDILTIATNALLSVTQHYQDLLSSKTKQHQSPAAIQKIIKEGYETLPVLGSPMPSPNPGATPVGGAARVFEFGYTQKWRESEWKGEIKRILRTVVEDGRMVAVHSS